MQSPFPIHISKRTMYYTDILADIALNSILNKQTENACIFPFYVLTLIIDTYYILFCVLTIPKVNIQAVTFVCIYARVMHIFMCVCVCVCVFNAF